uniref:Uncharacterized protein n=2 Tax=Amphimedon queenslandica TaxID=400682 RepID=A0A1X7SDH7_AMPQE
MHSLSILGYRSILDSMKSFAVDSDEPQVVDIEDVCPVKCSSCPVMKDSTNWLTQPRTDSDPVWYQPTKLSEAFDIYQANTSTNVKFVSGNTGKGVFKETATIGTYIELSSVQELYNVDVSITV